MSVKPRPSISWIHEDHSASTPENNPSKRMRSEMNKQYFARLIHNRAKLRVTSRTSALLTGFAMIAMVETQLTKDAVPDWLIVSFCISTTILIAVHLFALLISICILPNLEATKQRALDNVEEGNAPDVHDRDILFEGYVKIAWFCATAAGILLFLVEVTLISWVKFYPYSPQSAFISTWILFPLLFIFCAFAAHFYRKIFIYNAMAISGDLKDLERMANFSSSEILSV
ncbi:calcium release-activated calcium channel protein 1-like [Convolutriloba macropyga]|uniref:calcium release-activated calcium channel protein 1-like n=1 Tax=Convolutriloba macropyga TaxID=536237 RepID=UPI003F5228F6